MYRVSEKKGGGFHGKFVEIWKTGNIGAKKILWLCQET
jgi:hypothetical protein